jgi:proton-coupled amino acid transporter
MSQVADINKGHTNPAFTGDEITYVTKKKQEISALELNDKKLEAGEYDPYKHRKVEHPTTNSETMFHLLKGSLGTGILAMPNAFAHSGYIVGSLGTVIIGLLCTYCIHQLINAEYELCKRRKVPSLTYTGVAEAALSDGPAWCKRFAPYSVYIINIFLLVYQLGTCCVYVVFISFNIKYISDFYTEEETDIRVIMLIILLPLIFINWIKNLKFLAPFSTLANAVTLVSFGIILYYIFREPFTVADKIPVGPLSQFPLFFGTVLFALEAIGVILPLENEMKHPKRFASNFGVLNIAMGLIVVLYVGMGLFGYLNFGKDVKGSITLNLPEKEILAQAVRGMLAFAIFITHGLACYVAIDITWNDYISKRFENSEKSTFWEYVTRTLLVLITFLLAVAIPNLELFISLFGALCLSALGLAFPALIQTSTYWNTTSGLEKAFMVTKNIFIAFLACVGLVAGTYMSITEIYHEFFA